MYFYKGNLSEKSRSLVDGRGHVFGDVLSLTNVVSCLLDLLNHLVSVLINLLVVAVHLGLHRFKIFGHFLAVQVYGLLDFGEVGLGLLVGLLLELLGFVASTLFLLVEFFSEFFDHHFMHVFYFLDDVLQFL